MPTGEGIQDNKGAYAVVLDGRCGLGGDWAWAGGADPHVDMSCIFESRLVLARGLPLMKLDETPRAGRDEGGGCGRRGLASRRGGDSGRMGRRGLFSP